MTSHHRDATDAPSEQMRQRRRTRERRDWIWTALTILMAGGAALATGVSLGGNDHPLLPLPMLGFAAISALEPLVVEGADERQRYRALKGFSLAGAVTLAYLVIDAFFRAHNSTGYDPDPDSALRLFSVAWMGTSLVMRWGLRPWRPEDSE